MCWQWAVAFIDHDRGVTNLNMGVAAITQASNLTRIYLRLVTTTGLEFVTAISCSLYKAQGMTNTGWANEHNCSQGLNLQASELVTAASKLDSSFKIYSAFLAVLFKFCKRCPGSR